MAVEQDAIARVPWIEARLFASNYASRGDILRLKSLGVEWDGNVRIHEIPIQQGTGTADE